MKSNALLNLKLSYDGVDQDEIINTILFRRKKKINKNKIDRPRDTEKEGERETRLDKRRRK
jgi:hypothetical protein